jgi:hypothetical protein
MVKIKERLIVPDGDWAFFRTECGGGKVPAPRRAVINRHDTKFLRNGSPARTLALHRRAASRFSARHGIIS